MFQSCGSVEYKGGSPVLGVKRCPTVPRDTRSETLSISRLAPVAATMRLIIWWFLVVLNGAMTSGSGDSEHVHFKIHVPDIVKHQIHTKVVFVHVHEPKPKKKPAKKKPATETHHKEEHHDDWSSWSSYGHHEDHEDHQDKHSYEKNHADSQSRKEEKSHEHNHGEHKHYENSPVNSPKNEFHGGPRKYFPSHDYREHASPENSKSPPHNQQPDSYFPQWNSYDAGQYRHSGHDDWTPGRMLPFPHSSDYAVHENVKDTRSNEVEPYSYQYENGYRKGLLTKMKHLFEDQSSKFEDSKHEEENESKESSEDESNERTHAGRYLVDDTEYENYRNHRRDTDPLPRSHK